jgi:pSer/pThr/pTyr-binding forkhead associated (FHA) protein
MMDATKILGTEQGVYALDSALAAKPEACPHCQADIPAGEQFCPKCGYQRGTWGGDNAAKPAATVGPALYELVAADGARYGLPAGESVAGRGEAALRFDDGYISRAHAKFTASTDKLTVADLGSSNGTFVEGERLAPQAERELAPGVKLALGQREFTVERAAQATPAVEATQVMPTVPEAAEGAEVSGPLAQIHGLEPAHVEIKPAPSPWVLTREGQPEFFLPFGDTELGRKAEQADMVVRGDGYISGKHCKLVASLDTLEIIDLGSTNGTYVNNERCEPSQVYPLEDGYALRLGKTDLAVLRQDSAHVAAEEIAPVIATAEPLEPEQA